MPTDAGAAMFCTVAVCTHNGAERIPGLMSDLAGQRVDPATAWDVLVVDNASQDDTRAVCEAAFAELTVPARVVHEATPGLGYARKRVALEAQGKIVSFLDDDNRPAPDYVQNVIAAFERTPEAGVIGGRVLPRWECPPTPLAREVAGFALAICDLGDEPIDIDDVGGGVVGAGMCVRRDLLRDLFESEPALGSVTGRKGGDLIGGSDLAISILARKRGYLTRYDPSLNLEHCIPAARMEKAYLLALYEGIGRGQVALRRLYDWKARCPPTVAIIAFKDCLRWLHRRYVARGSDRNDLAVRMLAGRIKESLRGWRRGRS